MDSNQEAANLANIRTARLTKWLVALAIAQIVAPFVYLWLSQPSDLSRVPPSVQGGGFVRGWTPIILLISSSLVTATALIIVAFRRWRNKPLREQTSKLQADLVLVNSNLGKEKRAHQLCVENYERIERERNGISQQLQDANKKLHDAENAHKIELTTANLALRTKEEELEDTLASLKKASHRADLAEAKNLRVTNELALITPSKHLREMADKDAVAIQDAVVLSAIQFRNETAYNFRYVDFVFAIFNQSVYPISVDSIGPGDILFNQNELVKEKKLEDNKARNVGPRSEGNFTVRQFLDSGDIHAINDASDDRQFRFDNLKINLIGGAGYEDIVNATQLKIDCYSLSKQYPLWRNYNIGPFHSRFNGEIAGQVREVYFQSVWDLGAHIPGQDYRYDLCFVIRAFVVNHGEPKSIDHFRFALRIEGKIYEGERQSLAGFQIIRRDREPQQLKDLEEDNDEVLWEKRGGWLCFKVRGIQRYQEEKPPLEIELDAIDKNQEPNRLTPVVQSQWLGHAQFQESHIRGIAEWSESEMKVAPEN